MWRIVRHKCILKGLRRILEVPPKLPEITDALLADKGGGHTLFQRHQAKVSTLTREEGKLAMHVHLILKKIVILCPYFVV